MFLRQSMSHDHVVLFNFRSQEKYFCKRKVSKMCWCIYLIKTKFAQQLSDFNKGCSVTGCGSLQTLEQNEVLAVNEFTNNSVKKKNPPGVFNMFLWYSPLMKPVVRIIWHTVNYGPPPEGWPFCHGWMNAGWRRWLHSCAFTWSSGEGCRPTWVSRGP